MRARHLYEFDCFRLDCREGVLLSEGRRLRLEPKDLELLLVLVENHGHTVGKEELLEKVWPGTFVEEGNLARHISVLRQVLSQGQNGRRYIETIPKAPGRGTRCVPSHVQRAQHGSSLLSFPRPQMGPGGRDGPPRVVALPPGAFRRRFVWQAGGACSQQVHQCGVVTRRELDVFLRGHGKRFPHLAPALSQWRSGPDHFWCHRRRRNRSGSGWTVLYHFGGR